MKKLIRMLTLALLGISRRNVALCNALGTGTHENGHITRLGDTALAENLLCKTGSDADHVALTAAETDKPLGFCFAATDAAGDSVAIALLGKGGDTKLAVAGGTIACDSELVPSADGKVIALPSTAGTYWVIGRALTAADDGETVEVDDCHPYQVTVT